MMAAKGFFNAGRARTNWSNNKGFRKMSNEGYHRKNTGELVGSKVEEYSYRYMEWMSELGDSLCRNSIFS